MNNFAGLLIVFACFVVFVSIFVLLIKTRNSVDTWVRLLLFTLAAGVVWVLLYVMPLLGIDLPSPEIDVQNMRPCLVENKNIVFVENFIEGTSQFVCSDVTTDMPPVHLTLIVEPVENFPPGPEFVGSEQVENGFTYFEVDPPLPVGKYRARILYARTTYADIYFEVQEE
jgi:hypothetical protein